MKNYIIKNYKGNILESLKKFQEKYPDIKISKASVEDNALKIVGEKKEKKFEISYSYKVDNKGPEKKDKTTITASDRRTAKEKFFSAMNDNDYAIFDFEIKEVTIGESLDVKQPEQKIEESANEILEIPETVGEFVELLKKYSSKRKLNIFITEQGEEHGDLYEKESYRMRVNEMTFSDTMEIVFANGSLLDK